MKKSAENVKNTRGDGIDRYLGDIKSRIDSGIGSPVGYPYEKERLLLRAIRTGDGDTARRLLNEILGCIFFSCAYDTDSIKLRALELTVLMSRAALDGGADESLLSRMTGGVHLHTLVCPDEETFLRIRRALAQAGILYEK